MSSPAYESGVYRRRVSFSASAKRVRDTRQPFGRRVLCLHECLEQFNLFGFTATRARLRTMINATGDEWNEGQLIDAMDAFTDARRSWVSYLDGVELRRRAQKPDVSPPRRNLRLGWHNDWLEGYLTADIAERWLVTGLVGCEECGHQLIHHGTWACRACSASDDVPWEARCRQGLPPAA